MSVMTTNEEVKAMTRTRTVVEFVESVVAWLRSLFLCRHEYAPLVTTYAPPAEEFLLEGAARERAIHGVTTVLRQCSKCGKHELVTMLGSRSATPSRGKLIPLRREVF